MSLVCEFGASGPRRVLPSDRDLVRNTSLFPKLTPDLFETQTLSGSEEPGHLGNRKVRPGWPTKSDRTGEGPCAPGGTVTVEEPFIVYPSFRGSPFIEILTSEDTQETRTFVEEGRWKGSRCAPWNVPVGPSESWVNPVGSSGPGHRS